MKDVPLIKDPRSISPPVTSAKRAGVAHPEKEWQYVYQRYDVPHYLSDSITSLKHTASGRGEKEITKGGVKNDDEVIELTAAAGERAAAAVTLGVNDSTD